MFENDLEKLINVMPLKIRAEITERVGISESEM